MSRPLSPSHRQIEANRLNAAKSTGPLTEEGKARSSANALKHGLTAEIVLFPGEDPASVERLREALRSHYAPATDWEEELVEQAASIMVRLKRVPAFEVALFNWMRQQQRESYRTSPPPIDMTMSGFFDPDDAKHMEPSTNKDELETGRTFAALLQQNALSKVTRYEMSLQGRLNATLRQLDELKAGRLREESND